MKSTNDPLLLDLKDEDYLEQEIFEDNQVTNQILTDVECSEASTETEHYVSGFPDSSTDVERSETIFKENIEWECEIINPKYQIIEDGRLLSIHHYKWKIRVRLQQPWPRSCISLRLYQVCKSKHSFAYQSGENKICQESVFYDHEFESNLIFEGYVVDNGYDYKENKLFYCEIGENEYKKNGYFEFKDNPWDKYPLVHQKYKKYSLTEISKEQDFLLCLFAVEQNREIPLSCLKIRETFEYNRKKAADNLEEDIEYNIERTSGVDELEFPPLGQLNLPSANDRQFVFQSGNPSLGIKQKPVTIPNVLPGNITKDLFKNKIREIRGVHK